MEQNLCSLNSSAANKEEVVDWKLAMTWVGKMKGSRIAEQVKTSCFDRDRK